MSPTLKRLHDNDQRITKAQALITELVYGEVSPQSSAQALIHLLREQP
jgi:Fe2+ or Zn2+ uptake regulation protein